MTIASLCLEWALHVSLGPKENQDSNSKVKPVVPALDSSGLPSNGGASSLRAMLPQMLEVEGQNGCQPFSVPEPSPGLGTLFADRACHYSSTCTHNLVRSLLIRVL